MRDLIWTLILIWFAWQVITVFRQKNARRQASAPAEPHKNSSEHAFSERQKKLDTEGDYVDFEEIK